MLLGAAVIRHLYVVSPSAARRDALESTVIRLREGFRRKGPGSSSSFSEGCESSAKRSSSVEAAQIGTAIEAICSSNVQGQSDGGAAWNGMTHAGTEDSQEDVNSAKSLDSGRPSLALHNSSCPSTVLEFDNGITSVDQQTERHCSERNKHPAVGSSSGTESHGFESNTSRGTSDNQQNLDFT